MINNITLFNYKNTSSFTKNKNFYDILVNFYNYQNNFKKLSYNTYNIWENSLMVKLQSSKLSL